MEKETGKRASRGAAGKTTNPGRAGKKKSLKNQEVNKDVAQGMPERGVSDTLRGVVWCWVDPRAWSPEMPLVVLPVEVPGGGPDLGFWILQDGGDLNVRNGFAKRAIVEGRKRGWETLMVQISCSARLTHYLPILKTFQEWESVEFLAVEGMNVENRFFLVEVFRQQLARISREHPRLAEGLSKSLLGNVNFRDLFLEDPGLIGETAFLALPNLRLISWDTAAFSKEYPRLSAVSFCHLSVVESVEVFFPGYGKLNAEVQLKLPEKRWSNLSEEEKGRFYLPWV
ncbi:hypothetical protein AB4090_05195 [Acidithiobacillus sp. IBUN Pt1247-S3]|uniref:hypothetical protein n=1 Tax=Acidithiobacillus sp. IBUN Pt1247-S3 TaxID=3166642 RepID=UPI0034E4230A